MWPMKGASSYRVVIGRVRTIWFGFITVASLALPRMAAATDFETRCGWLDNPTPGNFFLHDRDGEWTVAEQGGYQAKGVDRIPDLSGDEFVETNGHHGYACVCMSVKVTKKERKVAEIASVKPKLLKACLGDPAIPPMPR
jgi:hypothetical protein